MMRHRKTGKFRHRSNSRPFFSRGSNTDQSRVGSRQFTNGRSRNNFKPYQNPEKLVEKYSTLAKEALASGDKTLSENYFQHADHFSRMIDNKNLNQKNEKNFEDKSKEKELANQDSAKKEEDSAKKEEDSAKKEEEIT